MEILAGHAVKAFRPKPDGSGKLGSVVIEGSRPEPRRSLMPTVQLLLAERARRTEVGVDPKEIFELIVKADERLKYATADKADMRAMQARQLLEQARDEARGIGNDALVTQAEQRLADLDALQGGRA